jgi:hypothetical protein
MDWAKEEEEVERRKERKSNPFPALRASFPREGARKKLHLLAMRFRIMIL